MVRNHVPPTAERVDVIQTSERSYARGDLLGIEVVGVHKKPHQTIFGDEVVSLSFPNIGSLWNDVVCVYLNRRLIAHFGNDHEVYLGRSDYAFWMGVKVISKSKTLGVEPYRILSCDDWPDDLVVNHYKFKSDHATTSSPGGLGLLLTQTMQEVRHLCVKAVALCPEANKGPMEHTLSPFLTRNLTCPMTVFPISGANKVMEFR